MPREYVPRCLCHADQFLDVGKPLPLHVKEGTKFLPLGQAVRAVDEYLQEALMPGVATSHAQPSAKLSTAVIDEVSRWFILRTSAVVSGPDC